MKLTVKKTHTYTFFCFTNFSHNITPVNPYMTPKGGHQLLSIIPLFLPPMILSWI